MPTVTLLEKLYGSVTPANFKQLFSNLVSGLKVEVRFSGTTNRGWVKLDVLGEDETAALSLIDQEVGLAPTSLDSIEKFSKMKGKIIFSKKESKILFIDLGISSPRVLDAAISKKQLCAQLADGKEFSLQNLVELFCLYDNVPIEVKIIEKIEDQSVIIDAIFSENQISLFHSWVRSRLDRLIVLGSFQSDVEDAVKSSRLSRDIIKIESLGVLEQVVLCKLGTDAVGLIPKLGRYLKSAILVPFSPKKILDIIGNQSFDWVV